MYPCPYCGAKAEDSWTTCRSCGDALLDRVDETGAQDGTDDAGAPSAAEEVGARGKAASSSASEEAAKWEAAQGRTDQPAAEGSADQAAARPSPPGAEIAPGGPPIPNDIRRWNWGAFFLSWIWGLGNRTFIAMIILIPMAASAVLRDSPYVLIANAIELAIMIVLGAKGSVWAWRNRGWNNVERFRRSQSRWALAGVIVFVLSACAGTFAALAEFGYLGRGSVAARNAASAMQTKRMITYRNAEYGFSFHYNGNLLTQKKDVRDEGYATGDPDYAMVFYDKYDVLCMAISVFDVGTPMTAAGVAELKPELERILPDLVGATGTRVRIGEVTKEDSGDLLGFQVEASVEIDGKPQMLSYHFLFWDDLVCYLGFMAPDEQWPDVEPEFEDIMASFVVTR